MNILSALWENNPRTALATHFCFHLWHLHSSPVGLSWVRKMFINGPMCVCILTIKMMWLKWECQISLHGQSFILEQAFLLVIPSRVYYFPLPVFYFLSPNVQPGRGASNSWGDLICWIEFYSHWYWIRCDTTPDCATGEVQSWIYGTANGWCLCHSTGLILLANSLITSDLVGISALWKNPTWDFFCV